MSGLTQNAKTPRTSTTPRGSKQPASRAAMEYTFSANTCLALIEKLPEELVHTEYNYLRSLSADASRKATTLSEKREAIQKSLSKTLGHQFQLSVDNLNILADNINTTLERTQESVVELVRTAEDAMETVRVPAPPTPSEPDDVTDSSPNPQECPVRLCEDLLVNFSVDDAINAIEFKTAHPGGRRSAYFGVLPYSYGRTKHAPAAFPDHPLFDEIFEKLSGFGVNREEYSILCTHYPNGHADLPLHQDNEPSIVEDSVIYTVSVGATRHLKVYNTDGPLREYVVPLENGTVYTMSRVSQNQWRHGLDKEPNVTDPRVSFTVRKLSPENETRSSQQRSSIPPIAPPATETQKRTSRVLLLTDSVHKSTPENLFEQVAQHTCVKKECYELTDVFKFENNFEHARTVILSCGVNDLSRYGKSANTLADLVCHKLDNGCRKHINTNFIFNSITHSRDKAWLNREIDTFNHHMYELSRRVPNLSFFDSHQMIKSVNPDIVWERSERSDNGIHLCFNVRKMIVRGMVDAVGKLTRSQSPRFREFRWLLNADSHSLYDGRG